MSHAHSRVDVTADCLDELRQRPDESGKVRSLDPAQRRGQTRRQLAYAFICPGDRSGARTRRTVMMMRFRILSSVAIATTCLVGCSTCLLYTSDAADERSSV